MPTTRTFVAIGVPEAQGARLLRLQSLLAPELLGVRWNSVSPFHLTLAFLGDVDDIDLNQVCRAVAGAVAPFATFPLRLEGFGAFPDATRARTLWVGLKGEGLPTLLALQSAVADCVSEAGYPLPEAPFRPHVTLGRIAHGRRAPQDLTPQLNHFRAWTAGAFSVSEVVTYASTLTREGPIYAPLARAPLRRGKSRGNT